MTVHHPDVLGTEIVEDVGDRLDPVPRKHPDHLALDAAERDPKVSQFLRQVKLDANDVNAWILAMEVEKKDIAEVAKAWVDANKDKIEKAWLAGTQ